MFHMIWMYIWCFPLSLRLLFFIMWHFAKIRINSVYLKEWNDSIPPFGLQTEAKLIISMTGLTAAILICFFFVTSYGFPQQRCREPPREESKRPQGDINKSILFFFNWNEKIGTRTKNHHQSVVVSLFYFYIIFIYIILYF